MISFYPRGLFSIQNKVFNHQIKARPLNAAEPKWHIKKLFVTDRRQMKLRSNTHITVVS